MPKVGTTTKSSAPKLVNRGPAGLLSKVAKNGAAEFPFGANVRVPVVKDKIAPALKGLVVPIAGLILDPDNARLHPERNLEAIKESLCLYGQVKPLVVRKATKVVVAGNGTLEAARALGWSKIAATFVEMSAVQAAGYGLADNRTAELAKWDFEVVARLDRLLLEAGQSNVGWSMDELAALRATEFNSLSDPNDIPTPPVSTITRIGDLWQLGDHRLLCGDSSARKSVERVMDGNRVELVFTDPPYGVAIGAKNRLLNSVQPSGRCLVDIQDDTITPDDLKARLLPAFILLRSTIMSDDCTVFVCSPQGGELSMMMLLMMIDAGLPTRHIIVWKKNQPTFSMGRLDYDYKHEPILMTWGKRHKKLMKGDHQTSVWEVDKPRASADHPTMKPIELYVNAIRNHTVPGDRIADIYTGSGTALVAAHQEGRRCFGVEIDQHYCDVAVQRWANFTGLDPVRESDGAKWSELKEESR